MIRPTLTSPPPLPDSEPDVERLWLSAAGSIFAIAVTLVAALAGYVSLRSALTFCGIMSTLLAAAYVLKRCGFNLNRANPNLTVAFLVLAALAVTYVIFDADQAPAAIVALYLVAFMFGVLTLDPPRLIGLAVFYWLCFFSAATFRLWQEPGELDVRRVVFGLVVYFMLLAWFSAMGVYIDNLRDKLRISWDKTADVLAELEEMAREDSLTGCYNRRYALELLALEAKRAERGQPLTLCLLDLDHFKVVNDTYGHAAGDEVLAGMARAVQPLLRATDALARYGGEEFLLLLSQTSIGEALAVCERVRIVVQDLRFPNLPVGVTVSIGAAQHSRGETVAETLQRADRALYVAKNQGRNRVVADPPQPVI